MSYINATDLQNFTNKIVDSTDTETLALFTQYCEAAENKIKSFLGYNPEYSEVLIKARGNGGELFNLKTKAFVSFESFVIGNKATDPQVLELSETPQYCRFVDGSVFDKTTRYAITINQGFLTIPAEIKTCALQIATLYMESGGGNLAVSSTSYADTGTRTFNNYKAERFLEEIKDYQIKEFF